MRFEWVLLEPGREITERQRSVVEDIGLTFLNDGAGTPIHKKKLDLGGERALLYELEQLGLIRNHWNRYYPTFPALYFLPDSLRDGYAGYLQCIFQAIRVMFEIRGPGRFQIEDVDQQTGKIIADTKPSDLAQVGLSAIYFSRAAFFLRDFQQSVIAEDSSKADSPVGAVIPTENMYDFVNLQEAWKLELERKRPAYMEPQHATPGAPVAAVGAKEILRFNESVPAGAKSNWETIGDPLGSGGQSTVYLVRAPKRIAERNHDIDTIHSFSPWGTVAHETRVQKTGQFADAVASYVRKEIPSDLGAMKVFKLREAGVAGEQQAINRLKQEIEVLRAGHDGLPKLLDHNLDERWMVTEYFPAKSLEYNLAKYRGNASLALKAFLSLAKTVAALHAEGVIHRDIKPANIFVREDEQLVLGDFGIVFLANHANRPTFTGESVGPHDYMPPWAEVEGRLAEVHSNFDVYMLGKLLWCMVTGRLRLQREYFGLPQNDVTVLFKGDPAMHMIDTILKLCVVERESDCRTSASDLVAVVSTFIQMLEGGGQLLHVGVPRPCRICGRGHYQSEGFPATQPPIPKEGPVGLRLWVDSNQTARLPVFPYVCDTCGHVEFFTRGATRPGARGSLD